MGKLKEKLLTALVLNTVVSPYDLLKICWNDYVVRDSEGRPRLFSVPYGRGYGNSLKRKVHEIRYHASTQPHGWRDDRLRLMWLEEASEHSVCPVRLYAFKGRLFMESKSKQLEIEL